MSPIENKQRPEPLRQLYRLSVCGLFIGILILLCYYCLISTSVLDSRSREVTYFLPDSPLWNLAALVCTLGLLGAFKRLPAGGRFLARLEEDETLLRRLRRALLWLLFALALFWVLSSQFLPGADQLIVQNAAYSLRRGSVTAFTEIGYLSRYPNQLGLFWASYLLSLLFGCDNYLVFQLLNAAALPLFYRELCRLCELFGWQKRVQLLVLLQGLLFIPLVFYTSFVYGNLIGLLLGVLGLRLELEFLRGGGWLRALGAGAAAGAAVLLKMNYLIFWIALMIWALMAFARRPGPRPAALLASLLLFYTLQALLPLAVARQVSGEPIDQGCSPYAWVAMGLQESPRAPGWYNKYNLNSYNESGYRTQAQEAAAKEEIAASLQSFLRHRREAVRFFSLKTASQWCDPDFQAFWIVQIRQSAIRPARWVWRLLSVDGQRAADRFLNLNQFVILCGSLLWGFVSWRRKEDEAALPAMIFVGGFLFHLFWEAKAQYTLPYYVLLFPYAAAGLDAVTDPREAGAPLRQRAARLWKDLPRYPAAVSLLAVLALGILYGGGHADFLRADGESYQAYFDALSIRNLPESGVYTLSTPGGLSLVCDGEAGQLRLGEADEASACWLDCDCGVAALHFERADLYLTAQLLEDGSPALCVGGADLRSELQWRLRRTENGSWQILCGDWALCYDEQLRSAALLPREKAASCVWSLQS